MKVKIFKDKVHPIRNGVLRVESTAWKEFEDFISDNPNIKVISHTHAAKPVYVPKGEFVVFKDETYDVISVLYDE